MPSSLAGRLAPETNLLLSRLTVRHQRRFAALCDVVPLSFGQVLATADGRIRHVYFPIRGFVSLIVGTAPEASLEVGLIGIEGMLGATVALDVTTSPLLAVVQGDGLALRMSVATFRAELEGCAELHALMMRYCFVILRQCGQAAACAHYHAVPARLARWMLMTLDRTKGKDLQLTQDFLSQMLGVRRVGITLAASALKAAKLISYQRGAISILNRSGLESVACACYEIDRRTYRRVLG